MAYAVFNPGTDLGHEAWRGYSYVDEPFVELIEGDAPGRTRRVELYALALRRYRWPCEPTNAERKTLDAFLRARGFVRDAFLLRDPADSARVAVALGVAAGGQVVFPLTTTETDEEFRHYPMQGTVVLKADGVPVAVLSVDTDARTITATAAPGAGKVMTADFTGLRLVRLEAPLEVADQTVEWYGYEAEIVEVLRD